MSKRRLRKIRCRENKAKIILWKGIDWEFSKIVNEEKTHKNIQGTQKKKSRKYKQRKLCLKHTHSTENQRLKKKCRWP